MKNIVLSSVVTALLIFSGCSDKEPVVNESANNNSSAQEVSSVNTETVSPEAGLISSGSEGMAGMDNMSDLETKLGVIYFGFDEFTISSDMQSEVANDAAIVKNEASKFNVKLEGNCDEWGSDEYNFALGLKRANAVKKALVSEGIDASKITMVSYGESNPMCLDKSQHCWAKNRRVDFTLLP